MYLIDVLQLPTDPEDDRFEEWRFKVDEHFRKLRFPLRPFRLHDPRLGLKILCFPFPIFFWFVDVFKWFSRRFIPCCFPLVWLAEVPRAVVAGIGMAVTTGAERVSNAFFPKPKVSISDLGGIVNADGKVIGRLYPMRPLTLVLHFVKMVIVFFAIIFIIYIIWLFVRWLMGLESKIHAEYVKDTTFTIGS